MLTLLYLYKHIRSLRTPPLKGLFYLKKLHWSVCKYSVFAFWFSVYPRTYSQWTYAPTPPGGPAGWAGLFSRDAYPQGCGHSCFLWRTIYARNSWKSRLPFSFFICCSLVWIRLKGTLWTISIIQINIIKAERVVKVNLKKRTTKAVFLRNNCLFFKKRMKKCVVVCHVFLTCAQNCYLFTHFVNILMGSWASQCVVWINRALMIVFHR